jgi:hypothetical protein
MKEMSSNIERTKASTPREGFIPNPKWQRDVELAELPLGPAFEAAAHRFRRQGHVSGLAQAVQTVPDPANRAPSAHKKGGAGEDCDALR